MTSKENDLDCPAHSIDDNRMHEVGGKTDLKEVGSM